MFNFFVFIVGPVEQSGGLCLFGYGRYNTRDGSGADGGRCNMCVGIV